MTETRAPTDDKDKVQRDAETLARAMNVRFVEPSGPVMRLWSSAPLSGPTEGPTHQRVEKGVSSSQAV